MRKRQEIIFMKVYTEDLKTLWHAGACDALSWVMGDMSTEDFVELIEEDTLAADSCEISCRSSERRTLTMCNQQDETKSNPCGYRARDLDLANCYGLAAGLYDIWSRMTARKDCPVWLVVDLADMIFRANCLLGPLEKYRDELKHLDNRN